MNKYFTANDKLATLSLFGLGSYVGARGFFWIVSSESVVKDSEFYEVIDRVMHIWIWGVIFLVLGLFLIFSSILYSKTEISNLPYYLMAIGGAGGAAMHFLMAAASLYNAINWLTPVNFTIMSAWLSFVAYIGGIGINERKRIHHK